MISNKKNIIIILILFLVVYQIFAVPVLAANLTNAFDNARTVATQGGYTELGAMDYVSKIITVVLSIMGVFFLILIIYGGFLWMSAEGRNDQVEKARNIIMAAVIGVIIVFSAYVISYFVVKTATNNVIKPTSSTDK